MPFDLMNLIKSNKFLTDFQIKKIMFSIFSAISYLHSRGVVHRDLKPNNILVNQDLEIKI